MRSCAYAGGVVGLALALVGACEHPPRAKPQICDAGELRGCSGPNGCSGGQRCRSDGLGYDACDCADRPGTQAAAPERVRPPDPSPARLDEDCQRLASALSETTAPPAASVETDGQALAQRAARMRALTFSDPRLTAFVAAYATFVRDVGAAADETRAALDANDPARALAATATLRTFDEREAALVRRLHELCGE